MKQKSVYVNFDFLIIYCFAGFLTAFLTGVTESLYFLSKSNSLISPNLQTGNSLIAYAGILYGITGFFAGMLSTFFSLLIFKVFPKNIRNYVKNFLPAIFIVYFYIKLFALSINPLEKNLIVRLAVFAGIILCTVILSWAFSKILNLFWKNKKIISATALLFIIAGLIIMFIKPIFDTGDTSPGTTDKPNIILIVMDTARADHLSCYGYPRKTSPNLDKLASKGVLFTNCFSASSWTFPSHSSIFTGLYPSSHGATYKHLYLDESNQTIAEILSEKGWETIGFTGNAWLSKKVGITQGFSFFDENVDSLGFIDNTTPLLFLNLSKKILEKGYDNYIPYKRFVFPNGYRKADELIPLITKKLEKIRKDKPFFLFINFNDVHSPYEPPDRFNIFSDNKIDFPQRVEFKDLAGRRDSVTGKLNISPEYFQHLNDLYDGEILFLDNYIGVLFEKMKELRLWNNTLVIVTSDHGESIGEHGLWDHGHSLYTEQTHIPLIIHFTGKTQKGLTVNSIVGSTDIYQTILDFAGIEYRDNIPDRSLKLFTTGENVESGKEYALSEIYEDSLYAQNILKFERDLFSLRNSKNTLITSSKGDSELYNRRNDPEENLNIISSEKEKAEKLKALLDKKINIQKTVIPGSRPKLDSEMQEKLKALGYIK